MQTPGSFHFSQLQNAIREQDLRSMQIMGFAMAMGLSLFAGIILVLHLTLPAPATTTDSRFAEILTLFSLTYAAVVFNFSRFLHQRSLKNRLPKFLASIDAVGADPVQSAIARYRRLWIIRMAMMEGSALLGAACCIMIYFNGLLASRPVFWSNLAPAALFLVILIRQFPTKANITAYFQEMT